MSEPKVAVKSMRALAVCLLIAISMSAQEGPKSPPAAAPTAPAAYKPVTLYDTARDPAKDLQDAIVEATRTNKRILLVVGGDWCIYCGILDNTIASHRQIKKVLDTYYVTVKINYSKENPNDAFLSHYPQIPDYPHFFVLDSKGDLLHSQPTHKFEHGKNYNAGKIDDFLKKWSQPPRHLLNSIG